MPARNTDNLASIAEDLRLLRKQFDTDMASLAPRQQAALARIAAAFDRDKHAQIKRGFADQEHK